MREITLYETIDGKFFTDANEAYLHERKTSVVFPSTIKEPPHKSGVYRWRCKPIEKYYTGQADDLNNRFWDFINALKGIKRYAGDKIMEAIEKYPLLSEWEYEVLEYTVDSESLDETEKKRIKEIPNEQTLNIQHAKSNPRFNGRFIGCKSDVKLTESEYAEIDEENKRLGRKYGFRFRLNWSLMNLYLGKKEISVQTVRHLPSEIGDALNFSVSNSTCYRQISDIGDRKHGYYAKIMRKGVLYQYGPFETEDECKDKYFEEKVKILKECVLKYEDILSPDIVSAVSELTVENASLLVDLR